MMIGECTKDIPHKLLQWVEEQMPTNKRIAQFMTYAAVNKFAEVLTIGGESVLTTREVEVPDLTMAVGKEQAAAVK
jgi:hypothetical protein